MRDHRSVLLLLGLTFLGCKAKNDAPTPTETKSTAAGGSAAPKKPEAPAPAARKRNGVAPRAIPAPVTLSPAEAALAKETAKSVNCAVSISSLGVASCSFSLDDSKLHAAPNVLLYLAATGEREVHMAAVAELMKIATHGSQPVVTPPVKAVVLARMTSADEPVAVSAIYDVRELLRAEPPDADVAALTAELCTEDTRVGVRARACDHFLSTLNYGLAKEPRVLKVGQLALQDESPTVVFFAINALRGLERTDHSQHAAVLDRMLTLVKRPEPTIRAIAALNAQKLALDENGAPIPAAVSRVHGVLVPLLKDSNSLVRSFAAEALCELPGGWDAGDTLIALMDDAAKPEATLDFEYRNLQGAAKGSASVPGRHPTVGEVVTDAVRSKAAKAGFTYGDNDMLAKSKPELTAWWKTNRDKLMAAK